MRTYGFARQTRHCTKNDDFERRAKLAIYSLNHRFIGKTAQKQPYTAAAHISYITRGQACSRVIAERMPDGSKDAQEWIKTQEDGDRKNARVCDKLMIALPKELDAEQRVELVREFAEKATTGRASWMAAIHDKKGNDRDNPHCHLMVRDRDPETGRRVIQTSERGSTERFRELWAEVANDHLERAGVSERIDHRSLEDQGLDREPTVHEGVRARRMRDKGRRPESQEVEYSNGVTARRRKRRVDYRDIDKGRTRAERNEELKARVQEIAAQLSNQVAERRERIEREAASLDALQQFKAENSMRRLSFRQRLKIARSKQMLFKDRDRNDAGREPGDW